MSNIIILVDIRRADIPCLIKRTFLGRIFPLLLKRNTDLLIALIYVTLSQDMWSSYAIYILVVLAQL
jgi:hypothetical protein